MADKRMDLPAVVAPRGVQVFDSAQHAAPDRMDAWREHLAKNHAVFDFEVRRDEPFYARLETIHAGALKINRGDCSAAHWARLSRHLSDGRDDYGLCLTVNGSFRLVQDQIDDVYQAGQFALIDNARPSDCYSNAAGASYDIIVPRAALRATQRVKSLSAPPILALDSASMRLLYSYVQSLYNTKEDLSDPVLAQKVGDHLLDLIILGLKPSGDAAQQAKTRGLRAARLRAILLAIGKYYCDPGIRTEMIAASVNISERYLHKLLEEQGLVFSRVVLDLRLNKAHNLLCDPRYDHLRIGQIAYECGFNDLSYFNRCFRGRYGDTPGALRGGKPMPVEIL